MADKKKQGKPEEKKVNPFKKGEDKSKADGGKDGKEEGDEKEIEDLRNANVVTKYRTAGDIATEALNLVIKSIAPGTRIVEVCIAGDKLITEKTGKIYRTGKIEKGIAFPTSISVNNVVGHFSPLPDNKATFASGDLVKIDLGVHIDGYVAVVAHSFVLGVEEPTGKAADVLACAYTAAESAFRLLKPGTKNTAITEIIGKVASEYKCNAVQGVLSHQMKRFVIDGEKVILNRSDIDQKVDEFEFAPNEVYAIDIVVSTGAGKPNEVDERTTIYKRAPDATYNLKRKVSRLVFGEIIKKHAVFPFNIRELETKVPRKGAEGGEAEKETEKDKDKDKDKPEKGGIANFAIKECVEHELVFPYPVLFEKAGELVAHVKFTALLLPTGTIKVAGSSFDRSKIKSTVVVKDEAVLKALSTSSASAAAKKKKKKNNKKKKEKDGGEKPKEKETS